MADEEISIGLRIDTKSLNAAAQRIINFKKDAKDKLRLVISFDQSRLDQAIRDVKAKLSTFQKSINIKVNVTPIINASQLKQQITNAISSAIGAGGATSKLTGLANSLNAVGAQATKAASALGSFGSANAGAANAAKGTSQAVDLTSRSFFALFTATATAVRLLKDLISNFASFELELATLGRLTGLSGDALNSFGLQLLEIGKNLGIASSEVIKLAVSASRLGVATSDIASFVDQTQKVAIALGISGDEAAETFRRFQLLFKLPTTDIARIADVFIAISDSSIATSAQLAEVVKFLGPVANQFDITGQKGISAFTALGATLSDLGVSAEVIGSGVARIFTAVSTKGADAAKIAGLSVAEFEKLAKDDLVGAVTKFAEGFKKLDGSAQASTKALLGLSNVRVSRVLTLLANNLDLVTQKQLQGEAAFKSGIGTETAVQARLATLGSQFAQLSTQIQAVFIEAFKPFGEELKRIIVEVKNFISVNPQLVQQIATFAIQVTSALAIVGSFTFAIFLLKTTLGSFLGILSSISTRFLSLAAALSGINFAGIISSIGAFGATLLASVANFALFGGAIAGFIILVDRFFEALDRGEGALSSLGSALAPILNLLIQLVNLTNPIAILLGGFSKIDLGPITKLEKVLGELLFAVEKPANTFSKYKIKADSAAAASVTLADKVNTASKAFNALTTESERTSSVLTSLLNIDNTQLSQFLVSANNSALDPRALLQRVPELQSKIAESLQNGGEPIRKAIRDNLTRGISEGTPESIAKVKSFTEDINKILIQFGKTPLSLKFDKQSLDEDSRAIDDTLKTISIAAKESGDQAVQPFLTIVNVLNLLRGQDQVLNGFVIGLKEIALLQNTFGVAEKDVAAFVDLFARAGININKLGEDGGKLGNKLASSFGVGFSEILKFSNQLLETKDILKSDFGSASLPFIDNLKTQADVLKVLENLDLKQISNLRSIVSEAAKRLDISKQVLANEEAIAEADEKGAKGVQKEIEDKEKLIVKLEELVSKGVNVDANNKAIVDAERLIDDLTTKLEKKEKAITREKEKQEQVQEKVNQFLQKSEELELKVVGHLEDQTKEIEKAGAHERENLRVLERQNLTVAQTIQARIQGLKNVALAELDIAKKQFDSAKKLAEKTAEDVRNIFLSGQEFLRAQQRLLKPNKVADDVEKLISDFESRARKGEFAGSEEKARTTLEQRINQVRKEGAEAATQKETDIILKRTQGEDKIADLRRKLFAIDSNDNSARDRELRAQGVRKEERAKIIAEEAAERSIERGKVLNDLKSAQNEIKKSGEALKDVQVQARDAGTETSKSIKEGSTSFESALKEGATLAEKLRKESEAAASSLTLAAKNLETAALALKEAASTDVSAGVRKKFIEEQRVQAEADVAKQQSAIDDTEKIGDLLSKLKVALEVAATEASKSSKGRERILALRERTKELDEERKKITDESTAEPTEKVQERRTEIFVEQRKISEELKNILAENDIIKQETELQKEAALAVFKTAIEQAKSAGVKIPEEIGNIVNKISESIVPGFGTGLSSEAERQFAEAQKLISEQKAGIAEKSAKISREFGEVVKAVSKGGEAVAENANKLKDGAKTATDKIAEKVDTTTENVIKPGAQKIVDNINKNIDKLLNTVADNVLKDLKSDKGVERVAQLRGDKPKPAADGVIRKSTPSLREAAFINAENRKNVGVDTREKKQGRQDSFIQLVNQLQEAQTKAFTADNEKDKEAANQVALKIKAQIDVLAKKDSSIAELASKLGDVTVKGRGSIEDAKSSLTEVATEQNQVDVGQQKQIDLVKEEAKKNKLKASGKEAVGVLPSGEVVAGAKTARSEEGEEEVTPKTPFEHIRTALSDIVTDLNNGFGNVVQAIGNVSTNILGLGPAFLTAANSGATLTVAGLAPHFASLTAALSRGGVANDPAVADAASALSGLTEAQDGETAAVGSLADAVVAFAGTSAAKIAANTQRLDAAAKDVAAAEKVLGGVQI